MLISAQEQFPLFEITHQWKHEVNVSLDMNSVLFFPPCYCRIWTKTRGRCCRSFTASTASSAAASPSVWWWWTTCCRALWRWTTSTIWRVPRTSAVHRGRSAPRLRPLSKIWTSRRCKKACTSTQTRTTPWWGHYRGTVGWVAMDTEMLVLFSEFLSKNKFKKTRTHP